MKTLKMQVAKDTTEYNYDLQVWVVNGICQPCGHDDCNDWPCPQRINAGLPIEKAIQQAEGK